jgi:Ceramidase
MRRASTLSPFGNHWRHLLTAGIVVGSLALVLSYPPFGQDPKYHAFADRRVFFGIPNFLDVASNLAFLVVGIAGLTHCLRNRRGSTGNGWAILFAGVALVSVGSAFYHLDPSNPTLVWDRLPMTVGFMGLFVALLGEYVSERLGAILLVPAILLGISSVVYWRGSDDLRFYAWVQLLPLLLIPVLMILYRARYSHQWMLVVAVAWYALAKVAETKDAEIFVASQDIVSGHTIKHLLSAMGCATILLMLERRKPI